MRGDIDEKPIGAIIGRAINTYYEVNRILSIKDVIKNVDLEGGKITVHLIPGLI